MKFSYVVGSFVLVASVLQACDSSDADSPSGDIEPRVVNGNRPVESRPVSSTQLDIFNDVVAAAKAAPQVTTPGATNLFSNPGFESGTGGWNNCAAVPLALSADAHEGDQALKLEPDNCMYRSVEVLPGQTYVLSCEVKRTINQDWTAMGLVFANSDYESVLDAPIAQATSKQYTTLVSKGTAPAGTSFATMWVHTDRGALVDSCRLVLEADQPVVDPDQGNLLDNSGFYALDKEGELQSWASGCSGEVVADDNGATLTSGACVDQALNLVAVETVKNTDTSFGCYVTQSQGYSDLNVFLDGTLAATKEIPPTQSNTYISVDVDAANASIGFVSLYSDDRLQVSTCSLDTAKPSTPTPPVDGEDGTTPVLFGSEIVEAAVRERLEITDRPITRDDMLELTFVDFFEENVPDTLIGLEYATNLEYIGILVFRAEESVPSNVIDLSPLGNLTKLNSVAIIGPKITDFTPLANSKGIETLTLETTPEFSDLSLLAEFPELDRVEFLGSSSISDLSPLSGLSKLRFLTVENGKVTDPRPVANKDLSRLTLTGSTLNHLYILADRNYPALDCGPACIFTLSAEGLDLSRNSDDRINLQGISDKPEGTSRQTLIMLALPNGEVVLFSSYVAELDLQSQ